MIMDFAAMNKDARLEPAEIAQPCELYVSGISITKLGVMFNMHNDKVYGYITKYYFGVIPKAFQLRITVQSKINDEPFF